MRLVLVGVLSKMGKTGIGDIPMWTHSDKPEIINLLNILSTCYRLHKNFFRIYSYLHWTLVHRSISRARNNK